MVFRQPALHRASGSVGYGPFPIRAARLLFSLLLLLGAIIVSIIALSKDHLACTPGARCVLTRATPSRTTGFPMSALRDARVDITRGSKGGSQGAVVLVLDGGHQLSLQKVSPERAAEVAAIVRAGIAGEQRIDVTLRGPWWIFPLAIGMLAMGLTMAYSSTKGLGRFHLEITRGGAALRARRFVLTIPVSSHEVSLEGVADVRVEGGTLGEMWLGKGEAPSPAGRIVLVDRSGAARPLTEAAFPGQAVHLRAAAELRELLGIERERHGVEEQLASLPLTRTPIGTRIAVAWAGMTVGALAGLGIFGLAGVALGLLSTSDPIETWSLAVGGGGGAIAGVALALYLTRSRPPR
ncbi:hypothetical protein [Sorangium cellulosum]|uniref:Uncharacterized protein n=1 Tax=Sorangium cellulosum TaxID=56 RepID=A0A150QPJ7_SORCE|nr:hypothetical protein [Sorangium cellulosum]KYF69907.1 hypothetical protein BE15_39835 [Sorangium cellulosum]